MLKLMYLLSVVLLVVLLMSFNPLVIAIILLVERLFMYFILRMSCSEWLGVVVVLLFAGGIIVVFIYMVRLISNVKITLRGSKVYVVYILAGLGSFRYVSRAYISSSPQIGRLYSQLNLGLLLFRGIYLIISLILCVNVTETFKGRLKKSY